MRDEPERHEHGQREDELPTQVRDLEGIDCRVEEWRIQHVASPRLSALSIRRLGVGGFRRYRFEALDGAAGSFDLLACAGAELVRAHGQFHGKITLAEHFYGTTA